MKRIALIIVAMMLLVLPFHCAVAETEAGGWYELTEDVITLRLPAEAQDDWEIIIDNPELLELLTCEFVEEDGIFAASFRNFSGEAGTVDLRMKNAATGECWGVLAKVFEDGAAIAGSYETFENVLTIRMNANPSTGYEWEVEWPNPAALDFLTGEFIADDADEETVGAGGCYVASFLLTEGAGEGVLVLNYARSWEDTADMSFELVF